MNHYEKLVITLNSAIRDQDDEIQIKVITNLIKCIEKSNDYFGVIHEIIKTPIGFYLNEGISSELSILLPSLKLIRHLITDINFRNYHFTKILKNVLRVLTMLIRNNTFDETYQQDLFNVIDLIDVLLKKYFLEDSSKKEDEDQHTMFTCLLNFIELVNDEQFIFDSTKNLTLEFFLHLLFIIETQDYIYKNFHLIMKIYDLADVFLDYLLEKYKLDPSELWIFKILEVLVRLQRSCKKSDSLQVKSFENLFYERMSFILEEVMVTNSADIDSEIFNFCISLFNTIVWSPFYSEHFRNKILKKIVKLKAHEIVFILAKSSSKIREHTQYTMKIFLAAFVMHSENSPRNSHFILDIFIQAHFPNSIVELNAEEVMQNSNLLILLYGCSFFKQELRHPLNASRIAENLAIILQNIGDSMNIDELWEILRVFAYFSDYAILSALEYSGVQKLSETLLAKTIVIDVENQRNLHPINKYIVHFAQQFELNNKAFNTMILFYISQEPSWVSSRIGQIIPSTQILPFVSSTNHDQVMNAVAILQRTILKQDDLDFIVKQCLCHVESDEIIVEGALHLINKNITIISSYSANQIIRITIQFLEAKEKSPNYSHLCYYLMMKTCARLVGLTPHFLFEEP